MQVDNNIRQKMTSGEKKDILKMAVMNLVTMKKQATVKKVLQAK